MRVFEITAVGRLSTPASKLASEDLPELNSPMMAIRSGRSKRRSMRSNARVAGISNGPAEVALSS